MDYSHFAKSVKDHFSIMIVLVKIQSCTSLLGEGHVEVQLNTSVLTFCMSKQSGLVELLISPGKYVVHCNYNEVKLVLCSCHRLTPASFWL